MAARHSDKGNRKIDFDLPKTGEVTIYSNQKVLNALEEISEEMPLYKGVRLTQVIEAAYLQGAKDGKHEILDAAAARDKDLQKLRPKRIGRPRKP